MAITSKDPQLSTSLVMSASLVLALLAILILAFLWNIHDDADRDIVALSRMESAINMVNSLEWQAMYAQKVTTDDQQRIASEVDEIKRRESELTASAQALPKWDRIETLKHKYIDAVSEEVSRIAKSDIEGAHKIHESSVEPTLAELRPLLFAMIKSCEEKGTTASHLQIAGSISVVLLSCISVLLLFNKAQRFQQFEERKRALETFISDAPVGLAMFDRSMCYIRCSKQYLRDVGLGDMNVVGKSHYELFPEIPEHWIDAHRRGLSGEVIDAQEDWIAADGSHRTVHWTIHPWGDSGVHSGGIILFTEDVTERLRAEHFLRESEERFRQVVESATVGIFISTECTFRYLNPAALALFGAERADQIVGQNVFARVHPDSRALVSERIHSVAEDGQKVPFLEEKYLRLDGSELEVEVTAIPFTFEQRAGALVFFHDITERNREAANRNALEQQLRQAQKIEAIGRLAGGIAHDFNNLLMVVQSYAEILQEDLPANDPARSKTQAIMQAAERGAGLTRQLLAFSRKQILSPSVLILNDVIKDTAKMLRRIIGEDIDFRLRLSDSLWAVEADSDQVVQVLMNLSVNARDAMPEGGTLTIATANVTVQDGENASKPYLTAGEYVELSVTDTGVGMSAQTLEQIFDPFFTTKEVGKGTGLGLATVYGIVKQSRGYIWAESELGRGACFTVYFPRIVATLTSGKPGKSVATPRGTEVVLVAEDEGALREAISHYLRGLEYTVLAGASGQQALSIASEQGRIDLLVTDLVMPKMSGIELSRTLGVLHPELKTIFMSGYTDDALLRRSIHELSASFLQKPFSLGTLARRIREMLDSDE